VLKCVYVPQSESTDPLVDVSLWPPDEWEEDKAFMRAQGDPIAVAGIGDGAVTMDAIIWQQLKVLLKDKVVVDVRVYPPNAEHARQIAAKVIEKLP
jgi:hypothetical protein